ncbi:MAG: hypothetical protein ACOC44_08420 [Promethearchaeia archaeon]
MKMIKTDQKSTENIQKKALFYIFGQISDLVSYQTFTFLTFTVYFTTVKINVGPIYDGGKRGDFNYQEDRGEVYNLWDENPEIKASIARKSTI